MRWRASHPRAAAAPAEMWVRAVVGGNAAHGVMPEGLVIAR